MTKPVIIILLLSLIYSLSSCYAFLKADKLVYQGTMAKKPTTLYVDTTYQVTIE